MVLESVNFHFWPYCNFKCKYCFCRFQNIKNTLTQKDCLNLISILSENSTKEINFVGGEPTLCPFLGDLIEFSKNLGLITSIISNGTGITQKFLEKNGKYIDWIGLSLDSGNESIQKKLGRGKGNYVWNTINNSLMVKTLGIKLKINTVITRLNFQEDMSNIIEFIIQIVGKYFKCS